MHCMTFRRFVAGAIVSIAVAAGFGQIPSAHAAAPPGCDDWGCTAKASGGKKVPSPEEGSGPSRTSSRSSSSGGGGGESLLERGRRIARQNLETARRNDAAIRRYDQGLQSYQSCLANPAGQCGTAPAPPVLGRQVGIGDGYLTAVGGPPPTATPVPTISPQQAAYMAIARLRFPTTSPGIGPSPKINPWKMAAVGYPLWLWSEGPTSVGPVSDAVANVSVSLEARISKTVFRMGDGDSVSCAGTGRKWTRAVQPGQKSPVCGYAYEKPSLPKGEYTVTAVAFWTVDWTVNGTSGQITVPRSSTTQLPVGELQAIVR